MKKFISVAIIATLLYFGYKSFNSENPEAGKNGVADTIGEKIPDKVFNETSSDDKYLEYFTGDKKVIYFGYADCRIGRKMASDTSSAVLTDNNGELAAYYDLKYELFPQGSGIYVDATHKAQDYLFSKCGGGNVCIINPKSKRMLQLQADAENYKEELAKYKDW